MSSHCSPPPVPHIATLENAAFFYNRGSEKLGPVGLCDLAVLHDNRLISSETFIFYDGILDGKWQRLSSQPDLVAALSGAPRMSASRAPDLPPEALKACCYPMDSRSDASEYQTVHVPEHIIGLFIGRNGCNLRSLEHKTGAKVRPERCAAPGTTNRPVRVMGEREQVSSAIRRIYRFISDHRHDGGQGGGRQQDNGPLDLTRWSTATMLVPACAVGHVMGRSGSNINRISQTTGARIQFELKGRASTGDHRRLELSGADSQVEFARRLVEQAIAEATGRTSDKPRQQVLIPESLVGLLIGRKGGKVQEIQAASGARIHIDAAGTNHAGTPTRTVSVFGTDVEALRACRLITELVENARLDDIYD